MSEEELKNVEFRFVAHVSKEYEHTTTYASKNGRLGFCDHVPYKNGEPCGRTYRHFRIDNKIYKTYNKFLEALKSLAICAVLLVVLAGCKTIEYVPVTVVEHKTDSIYFTQVQRDSIYIKDSTSIKQKGDTVLIEKWHTKYKDRAVHDTLYQSKIDTIPVPYPVTKYVEKELSKTQKGLMWMGILSFMAVVVFAGFKLKKFLP